MPATLPLLHKTPFRLDPHPLSGCASPRAGLLAVARTARALHLPGLIEANVSIKQRDRGLTEAQYSESILLSAVAGGEGYSDLAVLANDPLLTKGLGYTPAQPAAARNRRRFCRNRPRRWPGWARCKRGWCRTSRARMRLKGGR